AHVDPWRGARALFAAGFRGGDVVLNTFSYHLTPGGFIFDTSARALGCAVIPAGPGNTEAQFELIEAYRPRGYSGTPDFLKILLALGDLTSALPGLSPCGRTNMRIKGWMGRADQTTKVKGMFVRPEQIAEIGKRHPGLDHLRLVVTREGESDVMTLKAACASPNEALKGELSATLRAVTKL